MELLTNRKLATVRKILELRQIEGADKIEIAIIDGWQCVTQKGRFKVGDLGCYFEIDSFLPIRPEFEFLRKNCFRIMHDGSEGFRIRTIRLRGIISQGLLLTFEEALVNPGVQEGYDLTEALGVRLYEQPVPAVLRGVIKGSFPSFLRKTDEERVQNIVGYLPSYSNIPFEITEKIDGSSCTCYWKDDYFGVCSRNLDLKESEGNAFWEIVKSLKINEILPKVGNYALQGELYGEGVQKNPLKIKGRRLAIFNVFNIDKQRYLWPVERKEFLSKNFPELEHVPIIEEFADISKMTLDDILNLSIRKSMINPTRDVEGIVLKSQETRWFSFKVINNNYLLKDN